MTIGYNIRRNRRDMGLKQHELAKMVGVGIMSISQWECEKCYPSMLSLMCLADVFCITLDELVGRDFEK